MKKIILLFCACLLYSAIPLACIGEEFAFETSEDGLRVTGWAGTEQSVTVPSEINGQPVTRIGSNAFADSKADSISLPGSILILEEGAFRGSSLREIRFSAGLKEIGKEAFAGCTNLIGAALPESIQILGDRAFAGCSSLLYVTLPKNVTIPEGDPFADCPKLVSLPMPAEQPYLTLDGASLRSKANGRLISTLQALLPDSEEEP